MHIRFREAELRRSGASITITGTDPDGNPLRFTGIASVKISPEGIVATQEAGSDVIELLAQASAEGGAL